MVLASILRLVTHPKIFVHPTPLANALRFVDALLEAPGVEKPSLGPEWPQMRKLCSAKQFQGPRMQTTLASCHATSPIPSLLALFVEPAPGCRPASQQSGTQ